MSVSNGQARTLNKPVRVEATVKLRAYPIITEALEGALAAGIRKVFKYAPESKVDEAYLIAHLDTISNYLDVALCEVLDFGDD